jgi:hypothetical protein
MSHPIVILAGTAFLTFSAMTPGQAPSVPAKQPSGASAAARDGQRDFDPLLGTWKYHLKRRVNPLTGSNTWVDYEGTGICAKVWDGRGQLEQAEFHNDNDRVEGLVVRTYDPQTHQWRLNWANVKNGIFDPPQIGRFQNGRGEFFAQDTLNGKSIFVKFEWTRLNTDTPHFEQSYSDNGGKTWEVNWITDQTRLPEKSADSH